MAGQKIQGSGLLAQVLKGQLLTEGRKHAGSITTHDRGGSLPAGINNGIGQIVECGISPMKTGENAGKPGFNATATVAVPSVYKSDEFPNGITLFGRQFRLMTIPICDVKRKDEKGNTKIIPANDQFGIVLNWLKCWSTDEAVIAIFNEAKSEEDADKRLMEFMRSLCDPKHPTFISFRTWQPAKNEIVNENGKFYVTSGGRNKRGPWGSMEAVKKAIPRIDQVPEVMTFWGDKIAYVPNGELISAGVEDETAPESPVAVLAVQEQMRESNEELILDDLDTIAGLADTGSKVHAIEIQDIATKLGISKEEITGTENYSDLANLIRLKREIQQESKQSEETTEDELEEEPEMPQIPTIGEVYKFRVRIKKDGKVLVSKNPVEVEVTSVDPKMKTVDLKTKDGKVFQGVKFEDLIRE